VEKLEGAGVFQYEVSNYARPGSEAVHNSNYWQHENYLGLGPGAHSFWWEEGKKFAHRWNNESDLNSYLNSGWTKKNELEELKLSDLAEERLMLSLRTKKGITKEDLKSKYGFSFNERQLNYLDALQKNGKAKTGNQIQLTTDGLKIADSILLDLITM
jgi:oxygen-independent coproporphyrinogen-3 oxidase